MKSKLRLLFTGTRVLHEITLQFVYLANYSLFRYVFYFNHSSGHDRLRPNGLNANAMNKMLGGAQATMRDSKINDETYLGNFSHPEKLKIVT